jgi:ribonuclease HI
MSIIHIDGSGFNGKVSKYCVIRFDNEEDIYEFVNRNFTLKIPDKPYKVKKLLHANIKITKQHMTCNEEEYESLLEALTIAGPDDTIFTDSQLLVGHMLKNWRLKAQNLANYYADCRILMSMKPQVTLTWVPRDQNIAGKILDKL